MIATRSRTRRSLTGRVVLALFALLLGASTVTVVSVPAAAEGTCPPGYHQERVVVSKNPLRYELRCVKDGDDGDDGEPPGRGGGGEECNLEDPYTFCEGTDRCYYSEWHPPWAMPEGPKPSEDAEAKIKNCENHPYVGGITSYPEWYDPGEPPVLSLPQQAILARGNLKAPTFDLVFSPDNVSYVGTDTFFWADGVDDGVIVGTRAFTVVAVAIPNRIEVDPGDGGKAVNCGWATEKTSKCLRVYEESSAGSGTTDGQDRPSFTATATLVYDVEFRVGGPNGTLLTGLDLPPDTYVLESEDSTQLPVGEVQVIVE